MVAAESDFELLAPARLALFNFRYHPDGIDDETVLDRLNERLLETINDGGEIYLTQNRIRGRFAIRFAVGQTATTRHHVQRAWACIKEAAATCKDAVA